MTAPSNLSTAQEVVSQPTRECSLALLFAFDLTVNFDLLHIVTCTYEVPDYPLDLLPVSILWGLQVLRNILHVEHDVWSLCHEILSIPTIFR